MTANQRLSVNFNCFLANVAPVRSKFKSWDALHLQVNRDGEPMRSTKFQFDILPGRLKLHLPGTNLLSRNKGKHSPPDPTKDQQSSSSQKSKRKGLTSPQASFLQRVHSLSRPQFEDKNKQKVKAIASQAAKVGLVFGAGGVAGVIAQRRGWLSRH